MGAWTALVWLRTGIGGGGVLVKEARNFQVSKYVGNFFIS
jgi:hypothetical protein